jgi:starch phosphorylase
MMKESIKSLSYRFSTHRMLQDYIQNMYAPAMDRVERILESDYSFARSLSDWKTNIERHWAQVQIFADKTMNQFKEQRTVSGEEIKVSAIAALGEIRPSDVKVEVYYGTVGKNNSIENPRVEEMHLEGASDASTYRYTASIRLLEGGEYGYTFRIIPYHMNLMDKFSVGLIRWVVQ